MREIKFRAWDTEYEQMYTRVFFNHWMIWIPYDGENGEEENAVPSESERWRYEQIGGVHFYCTRVKDMVLMQYTGLRDCEGLEIYEGDLLGFGRVRLQGDKPYKRVHEVVWHESGFCLKQNLTKTLPGFIPLTAREIEENQLEVAGNIHENPELLEEAQQ